MSALAHETVAIGASSLRVPSLGVGAWSWGDVRYWGYGERHSSRDVLDAFMASVEAGATLFDTAEVYGHGASEQVLGWLARRSGAPVVLATKPTPQASCSCAGSYRPVCCSRSCSAEVVIAQTPFQKNEAQAYCSATCTASF